ncbi:aspartic peptidase domain-containing protein [Boletus reticuloceps]|uniref:Aspartic peptidase domain-containing protein n=1 Tax=Boletus reticuloceps TaxID=495285 RepID=A0A8I2YPB2_9AGAM|nr:aspartic peptidase domain-containing protein [Boletus reticuloceps]
MIPLPLLVLALLPFALAAPHPDNYNVDNSIHIPILRRAITPEQRIANLPKIIDAMRVKYGYKSVNQKRSTTNSPITDEGNDSSYSGVVRIGTPAQEFQLILDTGKCLCRLWPIAAHPFPGSSDLWVATDQCSTCSGVPLFNPSKSSSYKNDASTLQITYGSGEVQGSVSEDTVSFAGFTMSQQLLSVSLTTDGLLSTGLSGIIGLAFDPLSALQTTPFWQVLLNQNKLSSSVFSFYLARLIDADQMDQAPGGTFTLGGTNTSLYSGNIEFINMPSGTTPAFWFQQVQTMTVQSKSISISNSDGLAAVDTGTTLIAAPSNVAKEIWSNVPGSTALGNQFQGMYAFPCNTNVSVSISFGGTHWAINPDDMNLGPISGSGKNQMCVGGIFDIGNTVGSGQGVPSWIIGDTFLKNVYSVFQANPPAVGFAQLANGLSGSTDTPAGSSTNSFTGSTGIPVPTSSSSSPLGINGASPSLIVSTSMCLVVALLSGFLITF